MAKSSAAKTEKPFNVHKWINAASSADMCPSCGHSVPAHQHLTVPDLAHPNRQSLDIRCPDLPPGRQTVDQAVETALKGGKPDFRAYSEAEGRTFWDGTGFIAPPTKGGKPDFKKQLEDATGVTAEAERKAAAEENFEKTPGEPERMLIHIKQLRPMKNNPRAEVGDVTELERSMRSPVGFIGQLWVRRLETTDGGDAFEVFSGNRRLKAAKLAGLTEIPCDVYDITAGQALEINLTEQINRKDLSALEEGEGCRDLMDLQKYKPEQVAEKMGQSVSWVVKRLALCGLAPELKKALAKGDLSLTVANALAALPTQQLQVKSFDAVIGFSTAEEQVANIRAKTCRPLSDATWKLTDAELLPEAGACSTCPFNSSNQAMPGLFDNAKAKPTCAKTECFDDKASEAWLVKTSKARSNGAKALSLAEGRKLFHGAGGPLPESSRYVEGNVLAKKDKKGRTWGELAAALLEAERPQLHLAQDAAGKLRQLYVGDKLLEAIATHLKLKWAANPVEEATSTRKAKVDPKRDAEEADRQLIYGVRVEVTQMAVDVMAAQFSAPAKFPVLAARWLASKCGQVAVDRFTDAAGLKVRKDWLEKEATLEQCLALMWRHEVVDVVRPDEDGLSEELTRLCKVHGFNLDAAVKAQLATAKAESLRGKGAMS